MVFDPFCLEALQCLFQHSSYATERMGLVIVRTGPPTRDRSEWSVCSPFYNTSFTWFFVRCLQSLPATAQSFTMAGWLLLQGSDNVFRGQNTGVLYSSTKNTSSLLSQCSRLDEMYRALHVQYVLYAWFDWAASLAHRDSDPYCIIPNRKTVVQ